MHLTAADKHMKLTSRTILLAVVAAMTLAAQNNGGGPQGNNQGHDNDHQSPDLKKANPNGWVDVIIQFKAPPTKSLLKQLGIYGYDGGGQNGWNDNYQDDKNHFGKIKAVHANIPSALIPVLAKSPF